MLSRLKAAAETSSVDIEISLLKKNKHATTYFNHPGPEAWIGWIESTSKGAGAECLRKLVDEADRSNAMLRLCVDGDEGGGLYAYYEQFGFERDPAGGEIMERPPRG